MVEEEGERDTSLLFSFFYMSWKVKERKEKTKKHLKEKKSLMSD